jgi:predicted DNA-binding protein
MKKSFKIGGDIKLPISGIPYAGKGVWVSLGFSGKDLSDDMFEKKTYDLMDKFVERFLDQLSKRLTEQSETLINEMIEKQYGKKIEEYEGKMAKIRSVVMKHPAVAEEIKKLLNK